MSLRRLAWATVMPGLLCLASCQRESPAPDRLAAASKRATVLVDSYPLLYFAQRIAADAADVVLPAPRDVDPAFWMPDEAAIRRYQAADLILLTGATYAKWTERVSLPQVRLCDTSRAFAQEYITIEDGVVHRHGPGGEHAHQGFAFTTWLDPRLAIQQAQAIGQALTRLIPARSADFDRRFRELRADLQSLDAGLDEIQRGYKGQPLLASHPVYQYLARRGQWNLQSVHWEPEDMPDDDQWTRLTGLLEKHPARWMIWEAPPRPDVADKLRSLGVECAVVAPCGHVPDAGDYLQVMRRNVANLRPVFAEASDGK